MDQIRENLERISELSEEELQSLKDSVLSEFGTVKDQKPDADVVQTLTELADANDAILAEEARRTEVAAELSAAAQEAASRIEGVNEASDENPEEATAEVDSPEEAEAANADEKDSDKDDDEDEDGKKKKKDSEKKEFSSEDTAAETTPESEASVEEAPATEEVAELSTEEPAVEEQPAEAEASTEEVEAPAEEVTELSAEEPNSETTNDSVEELSTEEVQTESSEEPVTASNTPDGELDFQAPADRQPARTKVSAPVTITAGADIRGVAAGSELPDLLSVANAILDRKKGMGRTSGGDGEQHTVATFSTMYPEERSLASNDFEGNRVKIDNVTSPEAITAAGGLTAPVETSYDIFGLGETEERPVRNSLAVFGADRGGIRFMTPPTIADLDGAVSTWTIEDDIAAAEDGATISKPCLRVQAGEEVIVYTDAIPLCLTFGNLGARAYPELVERHTKLAMVQHARYAETRLLTRIGSLSTPVTAAKQLGAARDIFVQVEQAASAYRSRYRISPDASLRVIFPEWFKNALRADLTKQLPGDGNEDTFGLAEAKINAWFSLRNINVTWHIDGEAGQIFGEQNAGALLDFPSEVIWYLFSEGTFLFLDGGTLDLGLVRDSTLNSTNDYKLFVENFEGVAKVGVESLRVTSALAIAGASAATANTLA